MPRGKQLSEYERGQINAYSEQGLNATQIAKKVGRDRSTISRFVANPTFYGTKKRPGRPPLLKQRFIRRVQRAASGGVLSAREIKNSFGVPLTVRRVQMIISSCPHLKYEKRKMQPKLEDKHKTARVSWAESVISWNQEWKTVLFSDEKKFNLDGPDGWQFYWHDLRKEPQYFSKRVQGGGSLMVWAAFGYKGKSSLAVMTGRQDATAYQQVLQQHLIPCGRRIGGNNWRFQQDNAPIHTAASTKQWFSTKNMRILPWPSRSPDLNPIENLWGHLVRRVYANGRQFHSVEELRATVEVAWDDIPQEVLQILVNSMPKRLVEVLKRNGRSINY
jgi:transposase